MEEIVALTLSATLFYITIAGNVTSPLRRCGDFYQHSLLDIDPKGNLYSNLQEYEIVFPEFNDAAGNSIFAYYNEHLPTSDEIDLKIVTSQRTFKLSLRKSAPIIDSTFSMLTKKSGGRYKYEGISDIRPKDRCLYEGTGRSQTAAFSICNGLRGLLRTEDIDYVIQPVETHRAKQLDTHCFPHILAKKGDILHTNATVDESSSRRESFLSRPTTVNIRSKRKVLPTLQLKRTVETLVVVDHTMLEKHKSQHRTDVVSYVLTVMNMVNALFHDATLDTHLDISIIGLLLMEDDEELNLGRNAEDSLNKFCIWQAQSPLVFAKRPDHSILLTGNDICIDKDGCDTMGLARINGMCIRNETCSISEDTGLGLAFTIAHEIGHSLGMAHDGEGNDCNKRQGYVMSSTINSNNGVFSWSSCSRKALKTFLKTKQSGCLSNPVMKYSEFDTEQVQELPGQIYSLVKQCILQFGMNHTVCTSQYITNKAYICKMLWCESQNGACKTKHLPASEGSQCGDHMWCRRGECVALGSDGPQPIHGSWSAFSTWSRCSRSCGVGVKQRLRKCNNPSPRYGGRQCEGLDTIYELCNTFECPSPHVDFRSEQCAEFNTKPYRFQYFSWIPTTGKFWRNGAVTCELMCEAEGFGFSVVLASQVKDGTKCRDHENDICIAGKCKRVGCDLRLRSNATKDKCEVCNGNNSTCRFVNGSFTIDVHESDYHYVTKIPKGATNILIREGEERSRTHAYIAIKNADEGRYYLNGNWELDLNGEIEFAGSVWKYNKKYGEPEIVSTKGPTQEELAIEALILHRNPGIIYSYYEPNGQHDDPVETHVSIEPVFEWHQYITECTKVCAGGVQGTRLLCRASNGSDVNEESCSTLPKPTPMSFMCNTQPCTPKWVTRNWSQCSVTCGNGMKKRSVGCVQESTSGFANVSLSFCIQEQQPATMESCDSSACTEWMTERWSKCSKTCGRGFRTRNIYCVREDAIVPADACTIPRPQQRKRCRLTKCPRKFKWVITVWGKCSVTCGVGIQRRRVRCGREISHGSYKPAKKKRCRHLTKPKISKRNKCIRGQCLPLVAKTENSTISRWVATNWSECSSSCGKGVMLRTVTCLRFQNRVCNSGTKPPDTKECNGQLCQPELDCKDLFAWCGAVSFHNNACDSSYFEKRCCATCSKLKLSKGESHGQSGTSR